MPLSLMIKSVPFSLHAREGGAIFHKLVIVVIERLNIQEVCTSLKNEFVHCKVVSTFSDCLNMKGKFDAYVLKPFGNKLIS